MINTRCEICHRRVTRYAQRHHSHLVVRLVRWLKDLTIALAMLIGAWAFFVTAWALFGK
jgi:hypothetical protein